MSHESTQPNKNSSHACTRSPNAQEEYFFAKEGCYVLESWNDVSDPQCSLARIRVLPGGMTHWHALTGVMERYLILEGCGLVELGDAPASKVKVNAGDVVVIPPGTPQRISNPENTTLVFYAICTPRFTKECYQALSRQECNSITPEN